MRWIDKSVSTEPSCLTEHRATPGANYSGLGACKEIIRKRLLNEQGYLCAYCMQRISEERNQKLGKDFKTEIEHYESQAGNNELTLNYRNMLAVCNGFVSEEKSEKMISGKQFKIGHCDKTERGKGDGNKRLRILDPRLDRCEELIRYSTTGEIKAVDDHPDVHHDLVYMLNLNVKTLIFFRKEIFDKVVERLKSKMVLNKGPLTKAILKSEIAHWTEPKIEVDSSGNKIIKYKPFSQVAIWYLKRKMMASKN